MSKHKKEKIRSKDKKEAAMSKDKRKTLLPRMKFIIEKTLEEIQMSTSETKKEEARMVKALTRWAQDKDALRKFKRGILTKVFKRVKRLNAFYYPDDPEGRKKEGGLPKKIKK